MSAESSPTTPSLTEEDLLRLQNSRDAALHSARLAVRDTTRLTRLLAILSEPDSLNSLLDRALASLSELFSSDILVLLDPVGTGNFVPLAAIGIPDYMLCQPFSSGENSFLRKVMLDQTPLALNAVQHVAHADSQLVELGVETAVSLPLLGSHGVRGALIVARCQAMPFAESEISLLTAMAYRIGLALDDAQSNIQLEQIMNNGRSMLAHLTSETIAHEAVRILPKMAGANSAVLLLPDRYRKLHCAAYHGLSEPDITTLMQFGNHLCNLQTFPNNGSVNADNLKELLGKLDITPCCDIRMRTILAVPIRQKDSSLGVLMLLRQEALTFNQITIHMVNILASQLSAALENAFLYQAVQEELAVRMKAEQAVRASDNRFKALIRSVSDIIAILEPNGTILYISPAAETLFTTPPDLLVGQNILTRSIQEDIEPLANLLKKAGTSDISVIGTVRFWQGDDNWRLFEITLVNLLQDSSVGGIVATFHDITERSLYERELTRMAFKDPLTGLANRAYFLNRLQEAIARSHSTDHSIVVIFFDLDNFKGINDTYGHAVGDQVLYTIADRVRSCLRFNDLAARLGGDEFTVLIEGVSVLEQVLPIADRLLAAMREPIIINSITIQTGSSMGLALNSLKTDTFEDVLKKADMAMYQAKSSGKGKYIVYTE